MPSSGSSPWKKPSASEYETHFRKVIENFEASLYSVAGSRLSVEGGVSADGDPLFEKELEKLVDGIDALRSTCGDVHSQLNRQKEQSIFLLSRKTDTERLLSEARRLIEKKSNTLSEEERVKENQPLDAESERYRRSIAVKSVMVNRLLELLEGRNSVLRGVCDIRDETDRDDSISLSSIDRRNILYQEMTANFERTQEFEGAASKRCSEVVGYAEAIPMLVPSGSTPSPVSQLRTSRRSISGRKSRHRLAPVSMSVPASKTSSDEGKWMQIEQAIRRSRAPAVPVQRKKVTRLRRIGASSTNFETQVERRPTRALGPSLLLSPTEGTPLHSTGKIVGRTQISFSSPLRATRPAWDVGFNDDQEKVHGLSLAFPQQLKKVDASEASREALAGFGTTLEKTERASELKRSSKVTAPTSAKGSSAAAFPPMPKKAPTPFSSKKSVDKGNETKASSSYPPIAKQAPIPFSRGSAGGTQSGTATKPSETPQPSSKPISLQPKNAIPALPGSTVFGEKKSDPKATLSFGDLKGLGDSLFAGDSGSSPERSESDAVGLSLGSPLDADDETSSKTGPDYRSILIDFYTTHNPARVNEVDKTLERYKVGDDSLSR